MVMKLERDIIKNRVYKHFKGDYYLVLDIVYHSETKEEMVEGKPKKQNKKKDE